MSRTTDASDFQTAEAFAREQDAADPLRSLRDRFHLPPGPHGDPAIYLCGNSLGLQPKATRELIEQELSDWASLAVDGHFEARSPWYPYHEQFREPVARVVGAEPEEVVVMNSLTVNLHLMMVSFFRPQGQRRKILIDGPTFPSDTYAVKSQLALHGVDPSDGLIVVEPEPGAHTLETAQIEAAIARGGDQIALVLLSGVNFFTGQRFDIRRLAAAAHAQGSAFGLDLAHAAGNVPLSLHDDEVDFAVWCNYKYLNSGPGAVGGAFVHRRHANDMQLPRLAGWWGNDPATRFQMQLLPEFVPVRRADAWQLSNPPILAMAPIRASLELFERATMPSLRAKSERLTGYLEFLLDRLPAGRVEVITPRDPQARGCQLSLLVADERPDALFEALKRAGVVCDLRKPNVIRVAPVPLYNSFHDVWRFAQVLREHC